MKSRKSLQQQLLHAAQSMVQGSLSSTSRTCGKPACPCPLQPRSPARPNLYFNWRTDGKSNALYVPPQHADQAKAAQTAGARFWEIGCQIAALNRQQLRNRWSPSKDTTRKRGRSARRSR